MSAIHAGLQAECDEIIKRAGRLLDQTSDEVFVGMVGVLSHDKLTRDMCAYGSAALGDNDVTS